MTEQERRAAVRQRYGERCGYCGVHESEAGAELETDHFQPKSAGGTDDLDTLVYCCPSCNRLKGDFWPASDLPVPVRRLLHPGCDDFALHPREESDYALYCTYRAYRIYGEKAMIASKIWKAGNSYVVTIPREQMEARGLHVGQMVGIEPVPLELRPVEPLSLEQRNAGWKTQVEMEHELEKHLARDVTAGLLSDEEIAQADLDIDKGAGWVRRL
ncbi:MAG: HNH endonuclease [Chloroflexota bacterium]